MDLIISDILMGFIDLIPVGLFIAATIILQRDLYHKMSKGAFALFATGTIVVSCAGGLKAIHKILLTFRICNFEPLSQCFFPMQTIGFVLAGAGMVALLCYKQSDSTVIKCVTPIALLPIVGAYAGDYSEVNKFSGTMIFVVLMCLGVFALCFGMFMCAFKMKNILAMVLIVISFICILGMGYLSTKDDMNDWIKEFVNSMGQLTFLITAILLRKGGIARPEFEVTLRK